MDQKKPYLKAVLEHVRPIIEYVIGDFGQNVQVVEQAFSGREDGQCGGGGSGNRIVQWLRFRARLGEVLQQRFQGLEEDPDDDGQVVSAGLEKGLQVAQTPLVVGGVARHEGMGRPGTARTGQQAAGEPRSTAGQRRAAHPEAGTSTRAR